MAKNYSAIYFPDIKLHMTWNYGDIVYPENVHKNDKAMVTVVGKYNDKDVSCLIVEFNGITRQPKGTLLHITTRCENGAKPVESGLRATKKGYKKVAPYILEGVWN